MKDWSDLEERYQVWFFGNFVNITLATRFLVVYGKHFGNMILATWFLVVCGKHFGNMLIERYQDMRAEDPAQAEDFKKQMTERFQKIDVSDDGDDDDSEEDKD